MRHKNFKYKGKFRTALEMGYIFGITAAQFRSRLERGWKLVETELMPPARKVKSPNYWRRDYQVLPYMSKMLQKSFIGESVCELV